MKRISIPILLTNTLLCVLLASICLVPSVHAIDIVVDSYGNLDSASKAVVNAKVALWEGYFPQLPTHVVHLSFSYSDLGLFRFYPQAGVEPAIDAEQAIDNLGRTLAETSGFTENAEGRPTGATITISNNTEIVWYKGLTPPGPGDATKVDLWTVINHEICHAMGFTTQNSRFNSKVSSGPGSNRTYNTGGTGNQTGTLTPAAEGTHLDSSVHPGDLMNVAPQSTGVRTTPSDRDKGILGHWVWFVSGSGEIPTLSEWALIIFTVVIIGIMASAVVRQRKGVSAA